MAAFFTEFIRIDRSELESLLDPELERAGDTTLWLDHIGDLELVSLWDSLPNSTSDGTLMADILSPQDSELMVFSTPDSFLDAIRELDDNEISDVVEKWSTSDELSHWESSDLANVVVELREFVSIAQKQNQIVVQLAET